MKNHWSANPFMRDSWDKKILPFIWAGMLLMVFALGITAYAYLIR